MLAACLLAAACAAGDAGAPSVPGAGSPSLAVAPGAVSLDPGDSARFSAFRFEGQPGESTFVAANWSASGGSIDGTGRYAAGSTPGSWLVIATDPGSGLADTARVVIADTASPPPPPPPSGLANECAAPRAGWIWCDDFDQDRLNSYFEYVPNNNSFVREAGSGNGGSWAMRAHFAVGQVSAGALHLAFGRTPQAAFHPVDGGTQNYREIYWRLYLRNQAGWTGGGGDKLTRAIIFASSSSWAEAMMAHLWSGRNSGKYYLVMDPASGTDPQGNLRTTAYNDFPNLRWLGAMRGTTPLYDAAHVGAWHCVEAHVRLNDAGRSNGIFEFWVDGVRQGGGSTLNWVGSFNAYGINAVFLENYWNAGSPVAQDRWMDNFVVSTVRIGC